MAINTRVADLKVGDIILDGIASRVDTIIPESGIHPFTLCVTDGNGYSDQIRLEGDAVVLHFEDWTEEDWQAFLDM
jgi:hypothetical protein